jgi:hypothetical protein
VAAALLIFVVGHPLRAAIVPRSVEAMTERATYVVHGTVVEASGVWNADKTRIFTIARIEIAEMLKGDLHRTDLYLRVPGGVVEADDIEQFSSELPSFSVGQDVVLFVKHDYRSVYPIVSEAQGVFERVTDEATGVTEFVNQAESLRYSEAALRQEIQTAASR